MTKEKAKVLEEGKERGFEEICENHCSELEQRYREIGIWPEFEFDVAEELLSEIKSCISENAKFLGFFFNNERIDLPDDSIERSAVLRNVAERILLNVGDIFPITPTPIFDDGLIVFDDEVWFQNRLIACSYPHRENEGEFCYSVFDYDVDEWTFDCYVNCFYDLVKSLSLPQFFKLELQEAIFDLLDENEKIGFINPGEHVIKNEDLPRPWEHRRKEFSVLKIECFFKGDPLKGDQLFFRNKNSNDESSVVNLESGQVLLEGYSHSHYRKPLLYYPDINICFSEDEFWEFFRKNIPNSLYTKYFSLLEITEGEEREKLITEFARNIRRSVDSMFIAIVLIKGLEFFRNES